MPFLKTRFLAGQLGMVRNKKLLGHHNGLTSPDVGPRGHNASCALSVAKSKCFPNIPCPPDSAVSLCSHCNSSPNPTSPALLPNKPPSTYLHQASHVHFTNLLLGSSHSFTLTLPYYASQVKSSLLPSLPLGSFYPTANYEMYMTVSSPRTGRPMSIETITINHVLNEQILCINFCQHLIISHSLLYWRLLHQP